MNLQLQEIRKRSGLKQKEMAARLNVDVRTYGAWERKENMLSLKQAYDCAVVLGCTIDEIAGLDRERLRSADPYEGELVECYRAATSEGKANILGNARGQRELSLKTPERSEPQPEMTERSA